VVPTRCTRRQVTFFYEYYLKPAHRKVASDACACRASTDDKDFGLQMTH
jgi:hypothetical protein